MKSAWDVADALVDHLADESFSIACDVEGPVLVPKLERVTDSATLQVQPWSEEESPADRGDMQNQRRTVNVILQRPIQDGASEEDCLAWLNEVKASFGELTLDLGTGEQWRWGGSETVSLFDTDAAKEKSQFVSVFRATFYNFR